MLKLYQVVEDINMSINHEQIANFLTILPRWSFENSEISEISKIANFRRLNELLSLQNCLKIPFSDLNRSEKVARISTAEISTFW